MQRTFTLEYWLDDNWYVGRIKEVPGVFSQGETVNELEENIVDAYKTVVRAGRRLCAFFEILRKKSP